MTADLTDPDTDLLRRNGFDAVFHLAGIAHHLADSDDYWRVNVAASLRLARLAAGASLKHFVFVSSVKAGLEAETPPVSELVDSLLGPGGGETPGESTAANGSAGDALGHRGLSYGRSKLIAERALRQLLDGQSTALTIVRPALVYAQDAPGHLAWLKRWAALRMPVPPAGGVRSMVSRDDLVALLIQLIEDTSASPIEAAAYRELTLTDGEHYSAQRIYRAYSVHCKRRPLIRTVPTWAWRLGLASLDRWRGLNDPAASSWSKLMGEETYESIGLQTVGFTPRLTLEAALGLEKLGLETLGLDT
ncbi:MAG: NAD-dependent epimerase/dehydratase family protein [Congregibacter sp.]